MNEKKCFGIIGAMDVEIDKLVSAFESYEVQQITDLTFYVGTLRGQNVVIVRSGVGKVNAARCTQLLYDRFKPDYVINSGIAGGIASDIHVADFVIGSEMVQFDFDVTALGHARGYLYLDPDDSKPTVFRSDAMLIEAAKKAAEQLGIAGRTRTGRIASGDTFITKPEMKKMIGEEMGADANEMEGCAIAQVCTSNGVPFLVIRCISDLANGDSVTDYPAFEKEAGEISASFAEAFIGCLS